MTTETSQSRLPLVAGIIVVLLIVGGAAFFLLTGDDSGNNEELPEAEPLMQTAAANLQDAETFQMEMRHEGTSTLITEFLGFKIFFDRATALFIQPDRISALVSVQIDSIIQDFDLIIIGDDHYGKNRVLTQGQWESMTLAPGFKGSDLQDDEYGINVALENIEQLEMVGRADVDGIPVYHLTGMVDARYVRSVTVGLMGTVEGLIPVDIYVRVRDSYPARLILTEPRSNGEDTLEPTVWTIDFVGYNRDGLAVTEPDLEESTNEPEG